MLVIGFASFPGSAEEETLPSTSSASIPVAETSELPVQVDTASEENTAQQHTTPTVIDIALNDASADSGGAHTGGKTEGQAQSSAQNQGGEATTDIVAPNVDLKEVAPIPEVLPKADVEISSEAAADDGGQTGVVPAAPSSAASHEPATPKAAAKAGAESKAATGKPKTPVDKAGNKAKGKTAVKDPAKPAATTPSTPSTGSEQVPPASAKAEAPSPATPAKSSIKAVIENLKGEQPATAEETPFSLLGAKVPANTSTRLAWQPDVAITGLAMPVPVLVINGKQPGETLCLTAAIHGDELNGIEVVRRVMYDINPEKLSGQVIGIPIVNLQGFQRASRYLVDRRDLNRYFPGEKKGSLASRIAYSLFNEVIRHCSILVDLHTGSLRRTNLPQLRADMSDPKVAKFTEYFDQMVVVHGKGDSGMLRTAAQKIGIPAVTLEIGESLRLQEDQVESGVKSINSLMDRRQMYTRFFTWGDPEPIYYKSSWMRVERGGILFSVVKLGDKVVKGQVLGIVTDPITNAESKIKAPFAGRVIGMAVNQVVMPGFAAYHLGTEASERDVSEAATVSQEDFVDSELDDISPEEADPLESDPLE